jgi:myo-inositol 2-dehydrogenase / D-chiro-inositol 1-dehydrogenase
VRVGLVGAGAIAQHHVAILVEEPDVEVTAICDLDERKTQLFADWTDARRFTDWQEMLAADAVDALFVCTPPAHHAAPAIAALERGLPVYLEKPLARSLADGEAIAEAWRRTGAVCAVGYQWRALDVLDELRALLRGAQPGLLVSRSFGPTEGARNDLEQGADWFAEPDRSGGLLFELASHDIDLQIALAGPVGSVQATAESGLLALAARPVSALDDAIAIQMRFKGGGIGTANVAWSTEQRSPLYALDIHAAGVALELVLDPHFSLTGQAHGSEVAGQATSGSRHASVRRFLAAARSGDPASVPCTPADALATLRALLACERAIASGERVAI